MKLVWTGAVLIFLAVCLIPPLSVGAQDDDVDSLTGMQTALHNLAALLSGEWPPDGVLAMNRTADGAFILGDPSAPVTIVEFADFACPHCQAYRPAMAQFIESYVRTGRARLEFRFFPTAGGELTVLAARAAECADEQSPGAFWEAHELLYDYATSSRYDNQIPERLAADLDVDANALMACLVTANQIERDVALARELGVTGTPAVLIRYGDGIAHFIEMEGQTYRNGGPHFGILSAAVEMGQYR